MAEQTEVEEFVRRQVAPMLERGEVVGPCAYLVPVISGGKVGSFVDAATKMAAFAVLTDRRLLLIHTRIGAFRPLLENHGVASFERAAVKGVFVGTNLLIELGDGQILQFVNNSKKNYVSTQLEFFQRIQTLFGVSQIAGDLARREKRSTLVALVVGLLIAAVYLWYRF